MSITALKTKENKKVVNVTLYRCIVGIVCQMHASAEQRAH